MAKIYIELRSGLGNQLFQFSFGYALASEFHKDLVLCPAYFDPRWKYFFKKFLGREARAFRLPFILSNKYKITPQTAILQRLKTGPSIEVIDELKSDIASIRRLCSQNEDLYLKGYWQDPDFFSTYKSDLTKIIAPFFPISEKFKNTLKKLNERTVGIHVRRGDFLSNKAFGACRLDYYVKAIGIIQERVGNPTFIVFTNNRKWVEQSFPKNISYYIYSNALNQNTDMEEMFLMTKLKSVIISNSTFSWWGAYLNNTPDKNVICPRNWFLNSRLQENASKFVSEDWTAIDNTLELGN
jgi:hypothetical protein